jgi:lipoprotein-anchoring transpeptidase ErfK/SrfK
MFPMIRPVLAAALCWLAVPRGVAAPADAADQPAGKTAADMIRKQTPPRVVTELLAAATPENTRLVVNLGTQRARLMSGAKVCIDTPISSGKRAAPTPVGAFTILEKTKDQQSAMYGSFVDKLGRTVRSGVSMKLDAAPAGAHYVAEPMAHFCRITAAGCGIHGGILPGYPAAHGSIRVPEEIARLIFEKVRVGTPVEIRAD